MKLRQVEIVNGLFCRRQYVRPQVALQMVLAGDAEPVLASGQSPDTCTQIRLLHRDRREPVVRPTSSTATRPSEKRYHNSLPPASILPIQRETVFSERFSASDHEHIRVIQVVKKLRGEGNERRLVKWTDKDRFRRKRFNPDQIHPLYNSDREFLRDVERRRQMGCPSAA